MSGARSRGLDSRRTPSLISAGWFRLTLLLVILGILLLGGLAALPKWRSPSNILVLRPTPFQPPASSEVQSPDHVFLSSPPSAARAVSEAPVSQSPSEEKGSLPVSLNEISSKAPPALKQSKDLVGSAAKKEAEGRFRIQVGAFLDRHHADRLETRLKADNLPVHRVTIPRTLTLYQLRVNPNDRANGLAKRLRDLGLSLGTPLAEGGGTLIVDPPLPLKRAVDLSKRLKADGVDVELRRIDRRAAVYVVQVGEYASQPAAIEAQADLKARGYDGVVIKE